MDLLTFEGALQIEPSRNHRHLLLGNGFSIACKSDIFSYVALFDRADFTNLSPEVRGAFESLDTHDFEVVMRALRNGSALVRLYTTKDNELAQRMERDAASLREVLVHAIAQSHPEMPSEVSIRSYGACRQFLANFKNIYSLNYDLLLYWAMMHEEIDPQSNFDDGFRTPDSGREDYVTWDVEKTDKQNVHYLHGALHIFDADHEIKKYTWVNTGVRLIEQIRNALQQDMFPLIVAEGECEQKLAHINHSNLLSRSYRSFAKITNSLYVFGHSMAPNDDHILRMIEQNRKLRNLFVSIHGDPESKGNRKIIMRIQDIVARRFRRNQLNVAFFDADSARVWG